MNYLSEYKNLHEEWKVLQQKVRLYEYNILKKFLFKYNSILEIGIGDGILTQLFLKDFKNITICEPDISICNKIKSFYNDKLEIINTIIEDFPKSIHNGYDCIFLGHTLEHIKNPIKALKVIKEISNIDTIIYISVPNANSFHRIAGVKLNLLKNTYELKEQDFILGHQRTYDVYTLQKHINTAGLKIKEIGGILFKPLTNSQLEQLDDKLIDVYLEMGNLIPYYAGEIYAVCYVE